jgi:hypothetical protein
VERQQTDARQKTSTGARRKPLFALRVRSTAGPPLAARHGNKASALQRSPAANGRAVLHSCGLGSICAASSYQTRPEEADAPKRKRLGRGAWQAWHNSATAPLMHLCMPLCVLPIQIDCLWVIPLPLRPFSLVDRLLHCEYASASGARITGADGTAKMHMPHVAAPVAARGNAPYQRLRQGKGRCRQRRDTRATSGEFPSHFASSRTNGHEQRGAMTDKLKQIAAHSGPRTSSGRRA